MLNRKQRRAIGEKSPWLNDWTPPVVRDSLHAVALIEDSERVIGEWSKQLDALNVEACDAYDGACCAYNAKEFEQLEAYKKRWAEIETKRLALCDQVSGANEIIRRAKAYLAAHPLPVTSEGELCDEKGKTARPTESREVLHQGRLF